MSLDLDVITFGEAMVMLVAEQQGELADVVSFRKHVAGADSNVSFDPNLRPALWASAEQMIREINRLAFLSHWVMPGLSEGRILTGRQDPADIAAFYLDQGVEEVVIKLGAEGCYFRTVSEAGAVAAFPVAHIADPVGAGDGFAVGYVSARLEGHDAGKAAKRGNFVGAQVIQAVGDNEGLPRRNLVDGMEGAAVLQAVGSHPVSGA